ncbi:MAG: hypothetical protein GXP33_03320 [Spirochaetes bacterium]|nr:hypothetical protein [Spirochaetota bacterium]
MSFKKLMVVFIFLLVLSGFAFADLGDNFKAAGYSFWGAIHFNLDAGNVFAENNKMNGLSLSLYPGMDFLLIDNLAIWAGTDFYYDMNFGNNSNYWYFGFFSGFNYYFVADPKAKAGMVPSVGLGLGAGYNSGSDIDISLTPVIKAYYFITETIAPYIGIYPRLSIPIYKGEGFTKDNIRLSFDINIGMSLWNSTGAKVLIKK